MKSNENAVKADGKDFTCSITTTCSARKAADAIAEVSAWWARDVGGNSHDMDGIFTVRFGETFGTYRIIDCVPDKRIVWDVVDCHLPIFKNVKDWLGTRIIWEISTDDASTTIRFTHEGLIPGKECYKDCCGGWSFYIKESLLKLLEEGVGLPGVGIRATISSGDRIYKGTLFFKNDPLPDLTGEHLVIDVDEISGEHVTSARAAFVVNEGFDRNDLRGGYYLILERKAQFENVDPLTDILNTINIMALYKTVH